MIVISIANKKGGVGKTSFTVNIGYELSRDYKVLLLDFDAQCDLTRSLTSKSIAAKNKDSESDILDVLQGKVELTKAKKKLSSNLFIVPGSKDIEHFIGKSGKHYLEKGLSHNKLADFDIVLIDHPPGNNEATIAAMSVTDYVLIITEAEDLSIDNLEEFTKSLEIIQKTLNPKLNIIGLVANKVDMRRNLTKKKLYELNETYSKKFFQQYISTNTAIPLAMERKIPVRELEYRSVVVSQFQDVIREMLKRIGGQ